MAVNCLYLNHYHVSHSYSSHTLLKNNEAEAMALLICLSCSLFLRKHKKMNGEFILNIFGPVNAPIPPIPGQVILKKENNVFKSY